VRYRRLGVQRCSSECTSLVRLVIQSTYISLIVCSPFSHSRSSSFLLPSPIFPSPHKSLISPNLSPFYSSVRLTTRITSLSLVSTFPNSFSSQPITYTHLFYTLRFVSHCTSSRWIGDVPSQLYTPNLHHRISYYIVLGWETG
jgi:hypothetical protein